MDLETLLNKQEITELRLGYAAHIDRRDFDSLEALFTEDAVCDFGPSFGAPWVGRSQIRANYESVMASAGGEFDALHVVTNPWITLDGADTAHGRWYLLDLLTRQKPVTGMETPGGHANPLLFLGIYEDDYRRVDGVWKIAHVRLHILWPQREYQGLAYP